MAAPKRQHNESALQLSSKLKDLLSSPCTAVPTWRCWFCHELANSDGPVSGSVLGERIGASLPFLPQVMAPMIQAEWVRSERGPGGGYRLTESVARARLMDVIEAIEGPAETGRCVMRDAPCPGDPSCPIHGAWMQARQVLVENFERIPAFIVEEGKTK